MINENPVTVQELLETVKKYGFEAYGIFLSSYQGIVFNNQDPYKLGRVQIQVPQISKDKVLQSWAYPRGFTAAAKDFGFAMIPPKGARVRVSFENGSLENPLWEYGSWARGEFPELANTDYPKNRALVTENWAICLNDDKDLVIKPKQGDSYITIKKNGDVEINGKTVKTEAESHVLQAASSTETITGTKSIAAAIFTLISNNVTLTGQGNEGNGSVSFGINGHNVEFRPNGIYIEGIRFLDHVHEGVDPGAGQSGGVA